MIAAVTVAALFSITEHSQKYLDELWKYSPMTASQVGYHKGDIDRHLDDLSAESRAARLKVLAQFTVTLEAQLNSGSQWTKEDSADLNLIEQSALLETLELAQIRDYSRRCDLPLDSLGSVFFMMASREYAPLEKRASDVLARLSEVPRYLDQARAALTTNVDVFREAAKDDGDGLIEYLTHDLTTAFAKTKSATQISAAADKAAKSVRGYLAFVDKELPHKPKGDFRYGAKWYGLRFQPYLQTDRTPEQVLVAAEKRLAELHREMKVLAERITPGNDIRVALAKIAEDHPVPDALFSTVKSNFAQAREFVKAKKLLTLGDHDNLSVVPTPIFLRSMLGVAAFDGAPPLQPELGAFYYVTPLPKDWSKEKIEAKLREYNSYMLQLLTIHEAMPGHYVQFERANQVQPEIRRTLRWVLGAGSYVEGWAVYTQDMMVEAGYLDFDPRLRMQARKLELRAVTNAILDIKLQTQNLSDEAALKLMMEEGFQERPEAEAKLRRAKLSVTQLCSYFVGGEAWKEIRAEAQKRPGFDLRTFHDHALGEGAVTLPTLRQLLLH